MTEIEFKALAAQGYNRIPLIAETYADLDTPLGIYLKLAHQGPQGGKNTCLMESVVGGERFGRYSFIGLPARNVISARGTTTHLLRDDKVVETHQGDPLTFIENYQKRFKVALRPGMPRFAGGLAGYFGYDTVRHIEPKLGPATKPYPEGMGEGPPDILLMQIDELVIVDTDDALLVLPKSRAQDIRRIVKRLRDEQRTEGSTHRQVMRPWGRYDSLEQGPRFQVKRITVKPGAKLSLQMHHHRAEHWIVVSGTARVTENGKEYLLTENQGTYISVGAVHSLENPGKIPLELIEVQSGSYLGEDDIVRLSDVYGRC
jgi:mannose-6-phosphate isomerase-like protein (cupin superfamily)